MLVGKLGDFPETLSQAILVDIILVDIMLVGRSCVLVERLAGTLSAPSSSSTTRRSSRSAEYIYIYTYMYIHIC